MRGLDIGIYGRLFLSFCVKNLKGAENNHTIVHDK